MENEMKLNVALLRERVPNLTVAAKSVGLRPATVSNLCTGKIPLARAEVRTLVSLAELAQCKLDDLVIRKGEMAMIETGIKTLDFFAPIAKRGAVGFVARQGMGQLVLLTELFHRLKGMGFHTVFFLSDETATGIDEVLTETDYDSKSGEEVFRKLVEFGKGADIILGVDRSVYLSESFFELRDKLIAEDIHPTLAIVDTTGESVDEDLPYGPLDTLLEFDMELASQHYYPAVNHITSTSIVSEELAVDSEHLKLLQKAKKTIRRYKELGYLVRERGMDVLSEQDQITYKRGERLVAFFTQPFYVAEAFTKQAGETVALKDTLAGVKQIVNGEQDQVKPDDLLYVGSIN
ncbi:hypothetical protein KO561_18605 [Radiobacillus kanasensis]|uniref:ATP synthase beta subunit C-terminal domain-containing protein n=1 Tax=Radiobacillus kanasensis TaxID=2844358 RepID=UPI001E627F15|nr:hypothetical protein [Radiobacillus kanasensis]UFT99164.1 hypothetical protein KO561_18605 [Radiobacillus kanasensis]